MYFTVGLDSLSPQFVMCTSGCGICDRQLGWPPQESSIEKLLDDLMAFPRRPMRSRLPGSGSSLDRRGAAPPVASGSAQAPFCCLEAVQRGCSMRKRVVVEESNDRWNVLDCRRGCVAFPVRDGELVDANLRGDLLLEKSKIQPPGSIMVA
jgi:hypothetical protein